jgi:hypothetical protein
MGQIARMNRAFRFQVEFERDFVARSQFKVGQVLTVKDVGIGSRDGSGEEVIEWVRVQDEDGVEHTLETDRGVLFDPEYGDREDTVDLQKQELKIDAEEARKRLKKADLYD